VYKTPVDNWHMMGGIEHPEEDRVVDQEDDRSYFYQKWYNLFINHEGFFIVEIIFQVVYIFLLNCEASFLLTDKLFPWIHWSIDIVQSYVIKCKQVVISVDTPFSSTNKTDRHHITEILLKVALNTINNLIVLVGSLIFSG
jgi:hypothetical protein